MRYYHSGLPEAGGMSLRDGGLQDALLEPIWAVAGVGPIDGDRGGRGKGGGVQVEHIGLTPRC